MSKEIKDWKIQMLRKEFEKESDRAVVILVTSLIDQELTTLIRLYLLPCPNTKDEIFDSLNGPLNSLSSKILFAHRLGLISSKFARDLNIVRNIRNKFAHDVFGCNFNDGGVKQQVDELKKSINDLEEILKDEFGEGYEEFIKTHRGLFFVISDLILNELDEKTRLVNPKEEALLENFYKDYDNNEM